LRNFIFKKFLNSLKLSDFNSKFYFELENACFENLVTLY
jgi:hypothetical protein